MTALSIGSSPNTIFDRFRKLNWGIITILVALAFVGVLMHFSVSSGAWTEMPLTHGMRFAVLLSILLLSAMFLDTRFWLAIAYPLYAVGLLLLVGVEVAGATRMGATRWLDIGPLSLQPSEIMKIGIVLALARYYHQLDARRTGTVLWIVPPFLMIVAPIALIMHQPDLGTAMLVMFAGLIVMFLGGLLWRIIAAGAIVAVGGAIFAYTSLLHGYQRDRVNVFLGITDDPLGAGYHVLQSKIAIGSAGLFGRGYLQGTQSQLDFLPEKHTDFIFTMIVEEFGLLGGALVLGLFGALMALTMQVALRARSLFGKLAAAGVAATLACYVFINTAMVIGLVPVVGIPLPIISFGGTAMFTLMAGYTIVLSIDLHRDQHGARGWLW
ncbi:rod shape-determining protein RodA [Terricaulis silvestris]|uniref:Peptidoglycan glycosyltransferase MrdB n=1 Tax=Terricaulis silvestris TaxID=2686094 RepID=A0A6I6MR25_9CAUL|nr:rod shape-determining protein RodA [Terricaulis silvestris]QGZ95866.1 Rod shape-determining protein RodA [Terricaulis silvestris]